MNGKYYGRLEIRYHKKKAERLAHGISFEKPASITASASNNDLSTGANWNIVNDGTKAIPHKSIAIARIISRG